MRSVAPSPELGPTLMAVDLSALTHNLHAIRAHVGGAKIMAVVKANAYGHGLIPCAQQFEESGSDYLGVALVEEGTALRRAGITIPILVFGGVWGVQVHDYLRHNLDITASSVDKLHAIDAAASATGKRARVHLKIDTGLGRIGVQYDRLAPFADAVLQTKHCDIMGVFSHFASAESDLEFTRLQLNRFQEALDYFRSRGIHWELSHIANSAGTLGFSESHLDMVRPGLALYGVPPSQAMQSVVQLRPAMTLRSKVVYFKVVHAGQGISYGQNWHAGQDTRIVTIPVGYGDGYFRRLSQGGEVLIRGNRYPIVGNVCMDQMMVNIGQGEAYNGDDVILIGQQAYEGHIAEISATELADRLETTPHEILTATHVRVPRVYL